HSSQAKQSSVQEFPAFCFYIAFAAKCHKGNLRFEDGLSSVEECSIPTPQLCQGECRPKWPVKASAPLCREFFQASQIPLGSPTFSQSPFEVVHGRLLAFLAWRRFSSTLDAGKSRCRRTDPLSVHCSPPRVLPSGRAKEALECVLSAVGAR